MNGPPSPSADGADPRDPGRTRPGGARRRAGSTSELMGSTRAEEVSTRSGGRAGARRTGGAGQTTTPRPDARPEGIAGARRTGGADQTARTGWRSKRIAGARRSGEMERHLGRRSMPTQPAPPIDPAAPTVQADIDRPYAGLATRAVAMAMDAAIIHIVALVVSGTIALVLSVIGGTRSLDAAALVLGGVFYALWTAAYFVISWVASGQTVGDQLMRIRVVDANTNRPLSGSRAFVRLIGLTLAAIPLGAGFLILLWDDRRRAFQDRLVGSVVVHTDVVAIPPTGDADVTGVPPGA